MMTGKRLLVIGALVLGCASLVNSQTIVNVFRNKVDIRSTAADALIVRGGTQLFDTSTNPDVPNIALDGSHTTGAGYLGGLYYRITGSNIGRIAAKEYTTDTYGLGFSVFNISGLVERMKLSGNGELQVSAQPGFLAFNSSNDLAQAAGALIDFDTEVYDDGTNGGNFANDVFTAPITGRYLLCTSIYVSNEGGTASDVGVELNTSNGAYLIGRTDEVAAQDQAVIGVCIHADMDANDSARVFLTANPITFTVQGSGRSTFFSGRLQP